MDRYVTDRNEINRTATVTVYLVPWLVAIGLTGAWVAWVVAAQSIGTSVDEGVVDPGGKPFLYYACHGIGLVAVILAGILAAINGHYRKLDGLTRWAFWMLQITAITWAAAAYSFKDYASFKAFGATGPFVWMSTVLIFAGMDKRIWPVVNKVVPWISDISAILAIVAVVTTHKDLTDRWLSTPVYYMVLLMWFGGWTLLTSSRSRGLKLYLRSIPYIIFSFLTVVTKTRSWLVMSLLLFLSYWFLNKPTTKMKCSEVSHRVKFSAVILIIFFTVGFFLKDPLTRSFADLEERALQDTRTGQYVAFFSDVQVADLLLGRGPNGTWNWNGRDYQYFDNALLWMAFIGGIPTTLSYFVLIILPGIKAFGSGTAEINSAAALLLLWGLACTGFSTYSNPSLTPYSYLLCLLAGRCLDSFADKRATMKKIRSYNPNKGGMTAVVT